MQKDRFIGRKIDRQKDRQIGRKIDRQVERQIGRKKDNEEKEREIIQTDRVAAAIALVLSCAKFSLG